MTIPYMMNCPHSEEGWCLDCVTELVLKEASPSELKIVRVQEVLGQRQTSENPDKWDITYGW